MTTIETVFYDIFLFLICNKVNAATKTKYMYNATDVRLSLAPNTKYLKREVGLRSELILGLIH